jgi:hypothetical protein
MTVLTCPYCNALVPVPPGAAAGQSVTCPRCGDAFPLQAAAAALTEPAPETPPGSITNVAPSAALPPRQLSNRLVGGIILAMMLSIAAVALAYALATKDFRRSVDSGVPKKPRRAPPAAIEPLPSGPPAVKPADLEALGYLPGQADLILTIQTGELLSAPLAPTLIQDGIRIGRTPLNPDHIARLTGMSLQDLDHVVVGVHLDNSVPLHLWVVGRTREPYDADRLRKKLDAQRVAEAGDRVIHRFQTKQMPLPLNLFCPDDRTLVVSFLASDLKNVPATRNEDLDQLNSELVQVIRERVEVSPMWLAAHVDNWAPVLSNPLLPKYTKEVRVLLAGIRTAGVTLHLDKALTLKAAIHCKDADAARALDAFFHAPKQGANPSLKTQQDDAWLSLQVRTDLEGLRKSLSP